MFKKTAQLVRDGFPYLMKASAVCSIVTPLFRNLNLLEYQSKGLLENYGVTVQKFKMAGNADEVRAYITHT